MSGFVPITNPDTVRAPDVAFVHKDRVDGELPDQFFPGPPDLAIEVLSPSDSASAVQEKSEDWLSAGCHEVWLIDPRRKTASKCTLTENGVMTQSINELVTELLAGFELIVTSIFE